MACSLPPNIIIAKSLHVTGFLCLSGRRDDSMSEKDEPSLLSKHEKSRAGCPAFRRIGFGVDPTVEVAGITLRRKPLPLRHPDAILRSRRD